MTENRKLLKGWLFSLFMVLLVVPVTQAQQKITVHGTVEDAQTGKTLPGVNILVVGTSTGSATGSDGTYKLTAPSSSDTLRFSFIGYQTKNVPINGRTTINVSLESQVVSGQQMVVIGYGQQKKEDLTGAVTSVDAEELSKSASVRNVSQALQGRVAGVSVKKNSSAPGGSVSIRIRGNNSISSSNKPLYVVDGFPMPNGFEVNPDEIKNIEVLKSASATAIYGSRGANGVILITTKSGQSGKSEITYNGSVSLQNIEVPFNLLDAQKYMRLANALNLEIAGNTNPYGVYTKSQLNSNINTDWIDATTRLGEIQNHNLQFSGGNEKTQVYGGLGYFGNRGILKNTKFRRISGRLNISQKFNDYISAKAFFSGRQENSNFQSYHGNIRANNVLYGILTYSPAYPIYNGDGSYARPPGGRSDNPLASLMLRKNDSQNDDFVGHISLDITPISGLEAKIKGGTDVFRSNVGAYLPKTTYQGGIDNGDASKTSFNRNHYLFSATVTYDHDFNANNSFKIMGGYEYDKHINESLGVLANGFSSDHFKFNNLGAASNIKAVTSYKGENMLSSYFGRINYNYLERYLFTFTVRRDGSSRFGSQNRWGTFPSGAFAWRISDEPFMSNIDFVSNLKLRAGYGITGNDRIGNYAPVGLVNSGHYTFNGDEAVIGNFLNPGAPPNNNLRWETTKQLNIGVDFGVFNNRLAVTMNYYSKMTSNLLVNVDFPLYTGYSSGLINTGEIKNKGFELEVQSKNVVTQTFTWNTNFNIAYNKNVVSSLGERKEPIRIKSAKPNGTVPDEAYAIIEKGKPLGSLYGYVYTGVLQKGEHYAPEPDAKPGDPKFKDINGDGVIDAEDRTILGQAYPKYTFGMQNSFNYKNFNLSIAIYGAIDADLLNMTRMNLEWNRTERALDRWTPEHTHTNIPRNGFYYSQYGGYINSHFIENASYLKLQNITFGYNIPVHSGILKDARVYVMAENLFTLTSYSGWDPETDTKKYAVNSTKFIPTVAGVSAQSIKNTGSGGYLNANAGAGLDFNSYPSMRTYTFGIKLSF
jgi:TonB-linked SusC/RagA family outer membrane protein